MPKKNIYFYFKDAKTGKEIPKEVIDTLFLKNLSDHTTQDFQLAFGDDFINNCSIIYDMEARNRVIQKMFNFKVKLQKIFGPNVFFMDPKYIIKTYLEKYPQGIYKYFGNKKTGHYLSKKVVDVLFLNNLSDYNFNDIILAFGNKYLTNCNNINDRYAYQRIYLKIYRFIKQLETTYSNLYEIDPDYLINDYLKNNPQGIYKIFKNTVTNKLLDKNIVDILFLNNLNKQEYDDIILTYGKNYLTNCSNIYNYKIRERIRQRVYKFLNNLQYFINEDIYSINALEAINQYITIYPIEQFKVQILLNNSYLFMLYQEKIADNKIFIMLKSHIDTQEIISIFFNSGIYLDRKMTIREIATIQNIKIEDVCKNLTHARKILLNIEKTANELEKTHIYQKIYGQ